MESTGIETFWRRWTHLYDTPAEVAKQANLHQNVQLQNGGVVVAGFRKTGTTWLQQILHQLRSKGDMSFKDIYSVTKSIPWHFTVGTDFDPYDQYQPWTPRVFKSHDRYEWAPKGEGVRYVAIVRDQLDTLWSFAKFAAGFIGGANADMSSDDLRRIMSSSTYQVAGSYSEWLLSWFPHRCDPNVLWVHYEDLVEDLPFCVQRIADFAQISLSREELELAVEHSTFEFMREHKDQFKGDTNLTNLMEALKEEWAPTRGMVRPDGGTVGQGRKEMSAEVREYFAKEWDENVAKTLGFESYAELRGVSSLLFSRA